MKKKTSCLGIVLLISTIIASNLAQTAYCAPLFHPKDTLISMFKSLCAAHQTQANYATIGKSYENRDIYIFRIGNPNGGAVMWDGSMHGWEDIGSEIQYLFAKWLLTSESSDAQRILDRNYLLFIPIVNMDSTERGNRDFSNGATYGVDLNRNFQTGYSYTAPPGTSDSPYHGSTAASEPETQAMRSAFQTYRPKIYVNTHYGGGPYLQSYGTNTTLSDWIKARITELSTQAGFTFPWTMNSGGAGNGLAVGDANSFGANSWLFEIASPGLPIGTGVTGGPYMHTSQSLADVETYFFPKTLLILKAMCESCEASSTVPTTDNFVQVIIGSSGTISSTG